MKAHCTIPTASASRYLQQLCKHWAPKFAVTFDPLQGRIETPDGWMLEMVASQNALDVTVGVTDPAALPRWQEIVANHLSRFGFREELVFDWQSAPV